MSRKALGFVLCAFVAVSVAALGWTPVSQTPVVDLSVSDLEPSDTCADASTVAGEGSDPSRVPPGCCTSNCNTDKDCDRICGPGNCVCIVGNPCCRRCTW